MTVPLRNHPGTGSAPARLLVAATIFGVVFGSAKAQTDDWSSPVTLIPLLAGALLLIGFVVLQKVDRHPLIPLRVLADRNRGAEYLTLLLGQGGEFVLFLFLTYYFQDVLHYSPIKTGVAFLPMMVAVAVVATLTQSVLVQHLTMRVITVAGLLISGAGAALLTQADAGSNYAAWVLPGLILVGAGIGSAIVSAVAPGSKVSIRATRVKRAPSITSPSSLARRSASPSSAHSSPPPPAIT
jgi:predicted MFS family arabinose efflux permease